MPEFYPSCVDSLENKPFSLTDCAITIRDWLFNKNLITDSIIDNGLSSLISSMPEIGHPAPIENPNGPIVMPSTDITDSGPIYMYTNNIYNNVYQGTPDDYKLFDVDMAAGNIGNMPSGWNPTTYGYGSAYTSYLTGPLNDTSHEQRDWLLLKNQYVDPENEEINLNATEPITYSDQTEGYLNTANQINMTDQVPEAVDILGSIMNGGVGLNSDFTLNTNFDIHSSLLGMTLTGIGLLPDTPLGQIGAQQLALAMINNTVYNAQQETIGHINLNPLSLIQGDSIIVQNYKITVPTTTVGRALDFIGRISGFQLPVDELKDDSWIYGSAGSTTLRNNNLITNTGKGQVQSLFINLNANQTTADYIRYIPAYEKSRGQGILTNALYYAVDKNDASTSSRYADDFDSPYGPEVATSTVDVVNGVEVNESDNEYIVWPNLAEVEMPFGLPNINTVQVRPNPFKNPRSLVYKTYDMFKYGDNINLITNSKQLVDDFDEVQTSVRRDGMNTYISKGSAVVNSDGKFCRTWSTEKRYNRVNDLQKHSDLWKGNGNCDNRKNTEFSVLDDNGFVRISPYIGDDTGSPTNIKRFMFSIENLAWADYVSDLPPQEIGPGDLITGVKGRIMWFPPYDISFTENNSANWETTSFIGRPEPIYTYNYAERGGTLQFKIVVDHPSVYNELRYTANQDLLPAIAAGCQDIPEKIRLRLTPNEQAALEVMMAGQPQETNVTSVVAPSSNTNAAGTATNTGSNQLPMYNGNDYVMVYFPNDVYVLSEFETDYDNPTGYESGSQPASHATNGTTYASDYGNSSVTDMGDFGLNLIWNDFVSADLPTILTTYPYIKFNITGYASPHAQNVEADHNQILSKDRANAVKEFMLPYIEKQEQAGKNAIDRFTSITGMGVDNSAGTVTPTISSQADYSTRDAKEARHVMVKFYVDPNYVPASTPTPVTTSETVEPSPQDPTDPRDPDLRDTRGPKMVTGLLDTIGCRFINESEYFYKLSAENKITFDDIRQKLRWFHPAFHSTTPEGLNSRLTFLLQCTRAGSTGPLINPDTGELITDKRAVANNLTFGRPPVCILRIGDFYHTKIIVETVNFSFEPLVWDLNPEGIGVQPMIATVDMNFKFIGGSSLQGPINRLQNALSFNFFANNEIYSDRPDYIAKNAITGNYEVATGYRAGQLNYDRNVASTRFMTIDENQTANAIVTATQNSTTTPNSTYNATIVYDFSLDLVSGIMGSMVKVEDPTLQVLPKGTYKISVAATPIPVDLTNSIGEIPSLSTDGFSSQSVVVGSYTPPEVPVFTGVIGIVGNESYGVTEINQPTEDVQTEAGLDDDTWYSYFPTDKDGNYTVILSFTENNGGNEQKMKYNISYKANNSNPFSISRLGVKFDVRLLNSNYINPLQNQPIGM